MRYAFPSILAGLSWVLAACGASDTGGGTADNGRDADPGRADGGTPGDPSDAATPSDRCVTAGIASFFAVAVPAADDLGGYLAEVDFSRAAAFGQCQPDFDAVVYLRFDAAPGTSWAIAPDPHGPPDIADIGLAVVPSCDPADLAGPELTWSRDFRDTRVASVDEPTQGHPILMVWSGRRSAQRVALRAWPEERAAPGGACTPGQACMAGQICDGGSRTCVDRPPVAQLSATASYDPATGRLRTLTRGLDARSSVDVFAEDAAGRWSPVVSQAGAVDGPEGGLATASMQVVRSPHRVWIRPQDGLDGTQGIFADLGPPEGLDVQGRPCGGGCPVGYACRVLPGPPHPTPETCQPLDLGCDPASFPELTPSPNTEGQWGATVAPTFTVHHASPCHVEGSVLAAARFTAPESGLYFFSVTGEPEGEFPHRLFSVSTACPDLAVDAGRACRSEERFPNEELPSWLEAGESVYLAAEPDPAVGTSAMQATRLAPVAWSGDAAYDSMTGLLVSTLSLTHDHGHFADGHELGIEDFAAGMLRTAEGEPMLVADILSQATVGSDPGPAEPTVSVNRDLLEDDRLPATLEVHVVAAGHHSESPIYVSLPAMQPLSIPVRIAERTPVGGACTATETGDPCELGAQCRGGTCVDFPTPAGAAAVLDLEQGKLVVVGLPQGLETDDHAVLFEDTAGARLPCGPAARSATWIPFYQSAGPFPAGVSGAASVWIAQSTQRTDMVFAGPWFHLPVSVTGAP